MPSPEYVALLPSGLLRLEGAQTHAANTHVVKIIPDALEGLLALELKLATKLDLQLQSFDVGAAAKCACERP